MAGESNPAYTITPTRMVLDTRFSGADAAANAVGQNVVMTSAPRPFENEVRRDQAARRIIEPVTHGAGRNPHSVGYVWRAEGVNRISTGLRLETFGDRG
jgi:hypothetical protein